MHRKSSSDSEQSTIESSDQLAATKHEQASFSLLTREDVDFQHTLSTSGKHERAAIFVGSDDSGEAVMNSSGESHQGSNDGQPHSETHPAPQPPPFNPILPHNGQPGSVSALGTSVVPDLMKVYESMTQGSAPPDPNGIDTTSDSQHQRQGESFEAFQHPSSSHASQQEQQQGYYVSVPQPQSYYAAPPGSYEGPEPPMVPPIPDYPPVDQAVPDYHARTDGAPLASTSTSGIPDVAQSIGSSNSSRSLRKRSLDKDSSSVEKNTSKVRKKGQNSDGRWSKRFTWPDDLHRDFVSAIFDVGLKHSSPSSILEHMPKNEQITSERIKSHLQKYRVHRNKSKKEFMSSYDASLSKFNAGGGADRSKPLADGEVAAHLSHSTITDADSEIDERKDDRVEVAKEPPKPKDTSSKLILPQLSEEEKKSPLGTSLGYLMGLFFSLRQQLMAQRELNTDAGNGGNAEAQPVEGESQVGDIFSHFAVGSGVQESYAQHAPSEWQPPVARDGQMYHHDPTSESKAAPSTRTNFEQSMLMKQEMENQRAFQSKIRCLKQREVNKFVTHELPTDGEHDVKLLDDDLTPNPVGRTMDDKDASLEDAASRMQGAGETAEAGDLGEKGRFRGLSMGASDDFWNTDVVDENLFEFLMNP